MAMAIKKQTGNGEKTLFFVEDMIVEILLRVTMTTLFRCKSVCREWQTLISNPAFITSFATRSKSLAPTVTGVLIRQCKEGRPSELEGMRLYDFGSKIDLNDIPLDTSLSFIPRSTIIVASHNGYLLCAEKSNTHISVVQHFRYIVCNPLAKQWVDLPQSTCRHYARRTVLFCYSREEGQQVEFKVASFRGPCNKELRIETYSSEIGEWRVLTTTCQSVTLSGNIMFNGSVYFWAGRPYVYNLTTNTGRFFTLPCSGCPDILYRLMGVSSGSLYYACSSLTSFMVYVLANETEWPLMHVIDYATIMNEFPPQMCESQCGFLPIPFHILNHELILVSLWDRHVVPFGTSNNFYVYHTSERKLEHVGYIEPDMWVPSISYCLPAWIPFLENTSKENCKMSLVEEGCKQKLD